MKETKRKRRLFYHDLACFDYIDDKLMICKTEKTYKYNY